VILHYEYAILVLLDTHRAWNLESSTDVQTTASQLHLTQPASDQLHIGCRLAEFFFKIRVQNFEVHSYNYSAKHNQTIKCLLCPK